MPSGHSTAAWAGLLFLSLVSSRVELHVHVEEANTAPLQTVSERKAQGFRRLPSSSAFLSSFVYFGVVLTLLACVVLEDDRILRSTREIASLSLFSFHKLTGLRAILQLGAFLIAGSLTIDEYHHWYDVLIGSLIGSSSALAAYRMS